MGKCNYYMPSEPMKLGIYWYVSTLTHDIMHSYLQIIELILHNSFTEVQRRLSYPFYCVHSLEDLHLPGQDNQIQFHSQSPKVYHITHLERAWPSTNP